MMPDRLQLLLDQPVKNLTGIDFVYVWPDGVTLDVYFLIAPDTLSTPLDNILLSNVHIYDRQAIINHEAYPSEIPVASCSFKVLPGTTTTVLRLILNVSGGFSDYELFINDNSLDPFFNHVVFNFKVNCPSNLDCAPATTECPPETPVDFPIDYSARDFWSFRGALLDFASQRYPGWQDRLVADAGIMMVEVMSALGDEMSYYQDRIAREAYLESATQLRSVRRHAALVDYAMHDAMGAWAWLDIHVPEAITSIPAGINVYAVNNSGTRIDFETGRGLAENLAQISYTVNNQRNVILPYIWDKSQACLPAGSTEMWLDDPNATNLASLSSFNDIPVGKVPGIWLLLITRPNNPAQPARIQMVRVTNVISGTDPLQNNRTVTRIIWEQQQALLFDFDLTQMEVHGNLIPATAGVTKTAWFITEADITDLKAEMQAPLLAAGAVRAIERIGNDNSVSYRFSLPGSDTQTLVYLPGIGQNSNAGYQYDVGDSNAATIIWQGDDPASATAEIQITAFEFDTDNNPLVPISDEPWTWRRSLIGAYSSESEDRDFILDDGTWKRVVAYRDQEQDFVHQDYASGAGVSIRFGDGEFGLIPAPGTIFCVNYRLGGGNAGNVAPGALQNSTWLNTNGVTVQNPLPAEDGLDAETSNEVRQMAPNAFSAVTYRAVLPADYEEAVERLPEIQAAKATFRWTGSWITAFVSPDPLGTDVLTDSTRTIVENQMNRFRMAGRDTNVMNPVYANIDIEIDICIMPGSYGSEVKQRVMAVLMGTGGMFPKPGYFSSDNFTFGAPLLRSTLEATIQQVPGVKAVEDIYISRRGWFSREIFPGMQYAPGYNAIICVMNDLDHPDRGILTINTFGGS
jgi:hypothetical protein